MADIYSIFLTGASRGIGLEFVKQLLSGNAVKVQILIASCRSPETATELQELKKSNPKLHILKLDVTDYDAFSGVADQVKSIVGDLGLTVFLSNAGVGPGAKTLADATPEEFLSKFKTNTMAPILLTKAFLPLLKQSAQVNASKTNGLSVTRAAVIIVSSFLGSIQLNEKVDYHHWCYRESKAALNMAAKTLSIEFEKDGILVESIHPGHVRTDMGGPSGAIDTTTSVSGMIQVMLQLKAKNKTGYPAWNGSILPF